MLYTEGLKDRIGGCMRKGGKIRYRGMNEWEGAAQEE